MTILKTFGGVFTNRTAASAATLALLSTAIVVAAVQSEGAIATNVQLDDGAVWVTNEARNTIGRLNVKINELDTEVKGPGRGLDVRQDGRTVLFTGREGGVQRVDVYTAQPTGSNQIPIANYQIGGGVGAVYDPQTGHLWTGPAEQLVAPDYPDKPDAVLPLGLRLLVTTAVPQTQIDNVTDGTETPRGRIVMIGDSGWFEVPLDVDLKPLREGDDQPPSESSTSTDSSSSESTMGPDEVTTSETTESDDDQPAPILQLEPTSFAVAGVTIVDAASVGEHIAVVAADNSVLIDDRAAVTVPGDALRLQQTAGDANEVIVASTEGLFSIGLDPAATVTQLATASGTPSAPVVVFGCRYGAWSNDQPTWGKWCGDDQVSGPSPIPGAQPNVALVWRVNERNVVLNSTGNGDLWADHDGTLSAVGNWDDLNAEEVVDEPPKSNDNGREIVEKRCIEGGAEAPVSSDDVIGIRPRQSLLDLLYNDDDYNCEPIAIANVTPVSGEWGSLTVVDNGQHLLYSPSDEFIALATEQISTFQFTYSAVDVGGNLSAPSTVTVSVKAREVGNQPPALRPKAGDRTREMLSVVEEGQSVSYNVMADWWDPDGDDLRLKSAFPTNAGEVSFTPDGLVRFAANGVSPGIQKVDVTMTDGAVETTEQLEVTIKPTGSALAPVTSNDFVSVRVGNSVRVSPLANDSDPNEDPLELVPMWPTDEAQGYRTRVDGDAVDVTGVNPGLYNLAYNASDGDQQTASWIRVEVLAPGDTNAAPVAVPDQVKLRSNRVINVDVLANDVDADGDLLAVTDVGVADTDGSAGMVRASVVDRRMVQVEVVPGPDGEEPTGPFTISYQLSDGFEAVRGALDRPDGVDAIERLQSRGAVTVLVQPAGDDEPPIALPDEVVVRTGDIASIQVLRNDIDPDSDELTLTGVDAGQAAVLEQNDQAVVWVEDRDVFVRGGQPGRYSILYTVSAGGREASSELSIVVKPGVDENNPNQAPQPGDLVVRAVRNNTVRVKVPLSGVDPDGDSVELLDQLGVPAEGGAGNRAVLDRENPGIVLFTASPTSATIDSFTYTVRDRFGLEGVATVRVMVLDDGGWPPQAHDDVWRGKPGRTLSISVVANDSSPQDRRIELAELPFFDAAGQPSPVPVNGDAIRLLDQADPDSRGRMEVKVPVDGATLSEHYRISDGFNQSDAFIRVTPDPDTPNMRPVAQIDVVPVEAVSDLNLGEPVVVDVLANDYDPDDAESPLQYSVPANQPATFDDNAQLQIPVATTAQTVLYRITDSDGATTVGLVTVPGRENHPPVLSDVGRDPAARTITAGASRSLPIKVADITVDPDGDPSIALTDTEVQVVGGLGEVRRLADGSGFEYVAPDNQQRTETVGIAFEVTDRPELTPEERQAAGCNCLSSLVVEVVVDGSSPPRVLSAGTMTVPQLNEPVTYDVTPLTVDDQNDPLTYTFDAGSFGGLDVQVNGSTITVTSTGTGAAALPVGRQITLRYSVSDGVFDPVQNTVVVTISTTNKGAPATGALGPFEAVRDEPLGLPNLLDAAVNPFAADGLPLTLVNYSVTDGATLTCSDAGDCEFISADRKVRNFTVNYTISDALEQTATGSFVVTVKGLPLAPGVPRVESVGDHQVSLSWSAADLQGGTLVTYHVTAVEAGITKTFDQTGGTFDGLQNATEYHFTVAAENELGLGESSTESSVAIPDRVPDPPVGLVFTDYQDRALAIQWSPPSTVGDFSAIIQYEVSIGGQSIKVEGGTTSITVGNGGLGSPLQNGTDYSFKVRAQNSAKTNNGWGAWSQLSADTERPSRFPDPPQTVAGVNSGDGGAPRITVTWDAPGFDGGRAITEYQVCRVENEACKTIAGGTRQATFEGLARGETASFTVVALNSDKNRNNSDPSAASAAVIAVGNPDPPKINSVESKDHTLVVAFTPRNNSGCNSATTQFSINGGASWQTDVTFGGLKNGTSYSIIGRTVLASSCGTPGTTYVSGNSNSVTQTPYGPLIKPSLWVSGGSGTTSITWSWNLNRGDDGRPSYQAWLQGECVSLVAGIITDLPTGSYTNDFPANGQTVSCELNVQADGAGRITVTAPAKVQSPPNPSISVGKGSGTVDTCAASPFVHCWRVTVAGRNFTPNSAVTYRCDSGKIHYTFTSGATVVSDSKGNFAGELWCYHDVGPDWAQIINMTDGTYSASAYSEF